MFYWGSADHIQRDVEVWWRGMTWVVARPLTFDSLANLVTLAAFCWCRTPSPWWWVHVFLLQISTIHTFLSSFHEDDHRVSPVKAGQNSRPCNAPDNVHPRPSGKKKILSIDIFFFLNRHKLPPKFLWNQPEKRPVALPRYNFTETGQGTRVAYLLSR